LKHEVPEGCLVFEGEDLDVARAGEGVTWPKQRISSYGDAPISGNELLFIRFDRPGEWVEIELPGKIPSGRYRVFLFPITSWDYGISSWSLAGQGLGRPFDAHTPTVRRTASPVATVFLKGGLTILRVECVGKAALSSGCYAGLDALVLIPSDGR
jgi:hypothetical protein